MFLGKKYFCYTQNGPCVARRRGKAVDSVLMIVILMNHRCPKPAQAVRLRSHSRLCVRSVFASAARIHAMDSRVLLPAMLRPDCECCRCNDSQSGFASAANAIRGIGISIRASTSLWQMSHTVAQKQPRKSDFERMCYSDFIIRKDGSQDRAL